MSILYIANCKPQPEEFVYREPVTGRLLRELIPAGGQKAIFKDTDRKTLELIAKQHAQYGLLPVADIDRARRFVNLCFQFDKPVSESILRYGIENNRDELERIGQKRRDASAVAITSSMQKAAEEGRIRMKGASLEIQEEKRPGDNSDGLNEVITVDEMHGEQLGAKRVKGRR